MNDMSHEVNMQKIVDTTSSCQSPNNHTCNFRYNFPLLLHLMHNHLYEYNL